MTCGIPDRLLPDRVSIRRSTQSLKPSKRPVFHYETIATGIPARFNPEKSDLTRTVLGQVSKKMFQLFMNPRDIKENDEVVNESNGEVFLVIEAKNMLAHHLELVVLERQS